MPVLLLILLSFFFNLGGGSWPVVGCGGVGLAGKRCNTLGICEAIQ
jgi:hypothetical protein